MDTAQWPQIGVVKPMEEMATTTCSRPLMERRARPQKEQALNCPRCNSTNTKFCYYNNYSLTQPRYFCKTCRRYWTEGGSLRNVPVGGGSRKNKRSTSSSTSSSSSSASASSKKTSELNPPATTSLRSPSFQNTRIQQGQDLNLAFHTTHDYHNMPEYAELPNSNNSSNPATSSSLSALELLSGISSRGLSSFMQMPMQNPVASVYASGFGDLNDFKPSVNFPFDGIGGGVGVGYGNIQGVQEGGGRMLFPFEDLKPVSNTDFEQNRGQGDSPGYWNGMIGGGSW